MTMDVNKSSFQQRVARINAGQQWQPDGVIVGRRKPGQGRRKKRRRNPLGILSMPIALSLGIAAVIAIRYLRFHVVGDAEPGSDILRATLASDAAMAAGLAFVAVIATGLSAPSQLLAAGLGVGAASLAMHVAVHLYPDPFVTGFGEPWVSAVIASTDPTLPLWMPPGL